MAGNKWTAEQWKAITAKDCSLLVAAAAGAGKTAVLVERIIGRITDPANPVDIDRLLVVTFTNAAATEMRERIADAISARLEESPSSGRIQRQLTLLGKASITTIHSFCLEVIRSNFQNIDLDPAFRIADETESSLMKLEVLAEVFEEQYENESPEFLELLESYGGNRDDQALQDMVLNLFNFIQSCPWPGKWLEDMTGELNLAPDADFGGTRWGKVLLASVKLELLGLRDMLARAADMLKGPAGLEKYLPVFREDLSSIEALIGLAESWDGLYEALRNTAFSTLPRCGKEADPKIQAAVRKIRDEVKAAVKKLREKTVGAGSAEIASDLSSLYPKMKCLSELVIRLGEKYAEKKSGKSVADFNDLEHFCLEILTARGEDGSIRPSAAALAYRERFEEILVDEYQDSNLVQEIIIRTISRVDDGKPNVFMVGDVKQSIYRFRQARPELFMDKYNSYSSAQGEQFRKILLFRNFRSRREVVDAVNFIFKQIMSVNAGELDYTDEEALNPGAVFADPEDGAAVVGGETEFHLIVTGDAEAGGNEAADGGQEAGDADGGEEADDGGGPEEGEMLDSIQCEARLAARRILELMSADKEGRRFHVFDKSLKKYRRLEYRDIVILLRTTRNWSDVFMNELSLLGIPAFADTGTGFFKTTEVQVALSLLQVIDNPLQDIPLLSVLRSPIVSYTSDDLAELRLADRKAPLFHALGKLAQDGRGEASRKAAAFLENLARWREMSLCMSTDQLLWRLYGETGYYAMVGAMPAGEQRQANLRILFERARQFEETSYKGLFNFINFTDRLKTGRGDMGSAKILGENDNVVRIMSIHKSKGLEFPVVILSGCGKRFNLQDMNKSILLHQDLGFGPDVVDHRLRLSWPSAAKRAIREKARAETLSEEMRILYVAMTRAREKLIITGAVRDAAKAAARWSDAAACREVRLPDYEMLKGASCLDWIGPALIRHKSCGALRKLAAGAAAGTICEDTGAGGSTFAGRLIEDASDWSVKLWSKNDVLNGTSSGETAENDFISWLDGLGKSGKDPALSEEVDRRLSWRYPYSRISAIPAKVSVTELKRRFNAELTEGAGEYPEHPPALVRKPGFLEERKGLSPAEKGTVLHFVMQHLDYGQEDIEAQLERMVAKDMLTRQQARSVDTDKINRFLKSPLGRRMLASGSINREVPFNIEIPCGELYRQVREDTACEGETLLLQGVIDCYFEEPDGFVLLDYKTDYVPAGGSETIRERYRVQLGYYARALELLTGKKVKEKYVYLFRNGETIRF